LAEDVSSTDGAGKRSVPSPQRSIIENNAVAQVINENLMCKKCKRVDTLTISFPTVGVTSIFRAHCSFCDWTRDSVSSKSEILRVTNHISVVDFDTNMKFCLAFMSIGDGGRDAQRLLSFLSLPNATTMGKSTFTKLERATTDSIRFLTEKYLKENLVEEVRMTEQNEDFNFEKWKDAIINEEGYDGPLPSIAVSMDMGWQKRSSGRRFDSSSGHAFLVGIKTRKPVAMCLKSSYCSTCCYHMKRHKLSQEEIPEHECVVNHSGSAGSMESSALIEMVESLYDRNTVAVSTVITDDDSKMKSQCKWSNEDYLVHKGYPADEKRWLIVGYKDRKRKQDKEPIKEPIYRKSGLLRYPVPQPAFLADPAHRKKTFRNKLYTIKGTSVRANHGIKDGDILRLTLYYAYFIRQLKDKPEEEWLDAGKAIVDHHFDSHDFCGEWCKRKKETDEERLQSKKQYRNKHRESGLYSLLCGAIAPFISYACLKEVGHGANTNVNESLNQTISWLAPKNRTYCGSMSLRNRVGMAVSVHLVGFDTFYIDLFRHLGLHIDPHLAFSLTQTQRERLQQLQQKQSKVYKEKRRASYFEKMKQYFM